MARRRKQGAFADWVDLIALLPWWGGVALAIVAYLMLHHFAAAPAAPVQAGQIGPALSRPLLLSGSISYRLFVYLLHWSLVGGAGAGPGLFRKSAIGLLLPH
jgi:restriction system protein